MNHFTVAVPGGFAVAYHRHTGELFAVSEHATRATAEKEAYSLNAQYAARRAAAIAQAHAARHRQHAFAERRPVRWFEPDAFA